MDFVADQPALEFCTAGASEPASDGRVVLHAMPGIVLHLHGEHWAPVYLPALAPYLVNAHREGSARRDSCGPRSPRRSSRA